jgi:hypothetical protein
VIHNGGGGAELMDARLRVTSYDKGNRVVSVSADRSPFTVTDTYCRLCFPVSEGSRD